MDACGLKAWLARGCLRPALICLKARLARGCLRPARTYLKARLARGCLRPARKDVKAWLPAARSHLFEGAALYDGVAGSRLPAARSQSCDGVAGSRLPAARSHLFVSRFIIAEPVPAPLAKVTFKRMLDE